MYDWANSAFAAVIGPNLMGTFGLLVSSIGFSEDTAARVSLSSISILFAAGGVLFYFVDEKKGAEQTKYLSLPENGQAL